MSILPSSITFPRGFLDFIALTPGRRQHIGDFELDPDRLIHFNAVLAHICAEAPPLSQDQLASAARRTLERYRDPARPAFVDSRLQALTRLESMAADRGWALADADVARIAAVRAYRDEPEDAIPDALPVIGLLDDAVLIDAMLQTLHHELADYADYSRFCRVAADFANVAADDLNFTRQHWLEARQVAADAHQRHREQTHYIADPRVSLFHIG